MTPPPKKQKTSGGTNSKRTENKSDGATGEGESSTAIQSTVVDDITKEEDDMKARLSEALAALCKEVGGGLNPNNIAKYLVVQDVITNEFKPDFKAGGGWRPKNGIWQHSPTMWKYYLENHLRTSVERDIAWTGYVRSDEEQKTFMKAIKRVESKWKAIEGSYESNLANEDSAEYKKLNDFCERIREGDNEPIVAFRNMILDMTNLDAITARTGKVTNFPPFRLQYDYQKADSKYETIVLNLMKQVLPDEDTRIYVFRVISLVLYGIYVDSLFIGHGDGSNGKGLLDALLYATFSGAATQMSFSDLNAKLNTSKPTPAFASLRGKRILCVSESNSNNQGARERFNLATIKNLTGSNRIGARDVHEKDKGAFINKAQIWVFTNHLPEINDFDHGTWRRMVVVPFNSKFVDKDADVNIEQHKCKKDSQLLRNLSNKVLQPLYARAFLKSGKPSFGNIPTPPQVKEATNEYNHSSNHHASFLLDTYEPTKTKGLVVFPDEMSDSYKKWASKHQIKATTNNSKNLKLHFHVYKETDDRANSVNTIQETYGLQKFGDVSFRQTELPVGHPRNNNTSGLPTTTMAYVHLCLK
ncbi:hypothetical protein HDU87_002212 [Geranomyces variabilis]|uniref:SF3 helicase domain-containing protein n=1 Tax=Geranomyces variabilis TaxID=109894 RepID=A0AAD5TD25_9FUNG|nr:hypothetical protein HDU87_002212 [Geranomyces variabilis]